MSEAWELEKEQLIEDVNELRDEVNELDNKVFLLLGMMLGVTIGYFSALPFLLLK